MADIGLEQQIMKQEILSNEHLRHDFPHIISLKVTYRLAIPFFFFFLFFELAQGTWLSWT